MPAKRDTKLTRNPAGRSTKEINAVKPRVTIRFRSIAERDQIAAAADMAGCNIGTYLKALGTGYEPHSVIDRETQVELIRLIGLIGKQGGLIKMALEKGVGEIGELRLGLAAIEETNRYVRKLLSVLDDRSNRP